MLAEPVDTARQSVSNRGVHEVVRPEFKLSYILARPNLRSRRLPVNGCEPLEELSYIR